LDKKYRVSELIEQGVLVIGDGYRAKNSELAQKGIPFARAGNVNNGEFLFDRADYFPLENLHKVGEKVSQVGDVVFTSKGTVGRFAYVTERVPKFVYSPQLCFWRSKNQDVLQSRFLYYWMQGKEFLQQMNAVKGQTDMADYVSLSDQRKMYITVPSVKKQEAISFILGSLDDKIELNRRMNETLEQMAMALYKYWFVDFGPFSDIDENGLPIGWRWGTLEEIGYTYKDQVDPTELDYQLPYIGLEHMPKGSISLEEWEYSDKVSSNKFLFDKGDILFGKLRPYFKKVGVAPVNGVCSTDILVIRPKSDVFFGLLFAQVIQDEFIDYCSNTSNGTKMPRCDWNQMAKFKLPIPSDSVLIDFNKKIKSFVEQVISNIHENRMLIEIRDFLLPRLLSGEIEVREAEEQVEEVLANA